ncbi:MAG TPA: hypothetical protein VMC07_01095 [Candidatus Omnitrophota bacterium]|nr:hypothetical protein [Candidatus Omnitrophota bacterium]
MTIVLSVPGNYTANLGEEFKKTQKGAYLGENINGNMMYRAFGTNLAFASDKVFVSGDSRVAKEVRRGLSALLRIQLEVNN